MLVVVAAIVAEKKGDSAADHNPAGRILAGHTAGSFLAVVHSHHSAADILHILLVRRTEDSLRRTVDHSHTVRTAGRVGMTVRQVGRFVRLV